MHSKEIPPEYHCPNCGTKGKYSVTMTRLVTPIYDGPQRGQFPIAWDDQGSYVKAKCDACDFPLTPSKEDMDRLFVWRKGIVFEHDPDN